MLSVPTIEPGAGLSPTSCALQPFAAAVPVLLLIVGMPAYAVPVLHVDLVVTPTSCPWIPPWNPFHQMPPQLDRRSPQSAE